MMMPLGLETHSDIIELIEIPADSDVAKALHLDKGELVTRIVRCRVAGTTIVSLDISYFPVSLGRKLQNYNLIKNDIFILLENYIGTSLGYADLEIDITTVDEKYMRLLKLKNNQPVNRIRRLTYDINGTPIDYEYIYSPLDTMQFKIRLARW